MKLFESPVIHFVRSITLLATLVTVPGIAICWNHLPRDLWNKSVPNPVTPKTEKIQFFQKDSCESAKSVSMFVPESIYPVLPEPVALAEVQAEVQTKMQKESIPFQKSQDLPDAAIQQVSWEHSRMELPHNFESLELRLKVLGAKYYKLEKWGNRGELFRFSCSVPPSEPYSYEKYFQAIGTNEMMVMRTVIADIEKWKNVQ